MSTSRFCDDCESLLGDINLGNGKFYCSQCDKEISLPANDKTILKYFENKEGKNITPHELKLLSKLPTTNRIYKDCIECGFNIATCVNDANYKFSFTCIKCNKSYT
jgi:DNA-directed RNA polymerase subunit M/transcription elongation factor TFIIS